MSKANERQEGGIHYRQEKDVPQHWDLVRMYHWDYFQSQITKYLMRWKEKHSTPEKRLEDLKKARHFLDKYIEDAAHWDILKPTIVESHPSPRTQTDVDLEWDEQVKASAQFHTDGFALDGAYWKCQLCKQRVKAGSPLGALRTHQICTGRGSLTPPPQTV